MAEPSQPASGQEAQNPTAAKVIETRPTRHWRAWVFQGYLITTTVAFGVLFVLAGAFNYFPIDLSISRSIQTFNAPWFYDLMWAVSFIGYFPQTVIFTGILIGGIFIVGLRWEALTAALAALGASSLDVIIKLIVHRPRPTTDLVHVVRQLDSYSFPSGHVLTYTAFFGFLLFLTYTLLKPSLGRTLLLLVFGSLVGLIGLSRIYLGGHWASDVLGAYLLGSLWLTGSVYTYRWGKPRFFVRQQAAPENPAPQQARQ